MEQQLMATFWSWIPDVMTENSEKSTAVLTQFAQSMVFILILFITLDCVHLTQPERVLSAIRFVCKQRNVNCFKFPNNYSFLDAWFQLMPQTDMLVTDDCRSLTGTTLDFRVCFGTVSLSKGVHYWEVSIDRIDVNTDVVLGVAQQAANVHQILGKDLHGW
jgi:hypothetical protein